VKLVEFNYTKANGTAGVRAVVEVSQPSNYFEGIDVTQMPEDEFAEFTREYRDLLEQQYNAKMSVMQKYDLTHSYRRFIPEKMTDVTTDHI
jgi:predicted transcriptional regulator YdeE